MRRPNIVFYFSDQQRWDTLGCYGQPLPVSPNLDRLAESGVLFENAFTCQPVCGPAPFLSAKRDVCHSDWVLYQ